MSCFVRQQAALPGAAPDPGKHVNFVQGMILGVDDFTQEFAYLSGRDRAFAREALGYGTLRGLALSWGTDDKGTVLPVIQVTPGTALTPGGRLVRVPREQCANLNKWLENHDQEISARFADAKKGQQLTLHVVLSFLDCPTDHTPIPGEPCRVAADLMQPSRVTDSFLLDFAIEPPEKCSATAPLQGEEEAVRAFFAWLRAIPIDRNPNKSTNRSKFESAVRGWTTSTTALDNMVISQADVVDYYGIALRIWVTELRPQQELVAAKARFDAWVKAAPIATGKVVGKSVEELLGEAGRWTPLTTNWRTDLFVVKSEQEKQKFVDQASELWTKSLASRWFDPALGRSRLDSATEQDDRVLLGTVTFNVEKVGQAWSAVIPDSASDMPSLDQSMRPIVLHLRAAQEAMIPPPTVKEAAPPVVTPATRFVIVAAGRLNLIQPEGRPRPIEGTPFIAGVTDGFVILRFKEYDWKLVDKKEVDYVVKVLACSPEVQGPGPITHIETGSPDLELVFRFQSFEKEGIKLRVTASGKPVAAKTLAMLSAYFEVTAVQLKH